MNTAVRGERAQREGMNKEGQMKKTEQGEGIFLQMFHFNTKESRRCIEI